MEYDVIVVGAGNAALCAALSARENVPRGAVFEFHLPLGDDPDPTGQNA